LILPFIDNLFNWVQMNYIVDDLHQQY